MKSTFSAFTLLLCCAAAVVGCSSTVVVHDISGPPKPVADTIDGVPMQFAARHKLTVYAKQPDGSYKEVHKLDYAMPDQSRLFAVNVDSKTLANHTLTLALYDEGTPKTVGLTTTSQGQAALTQLGTSAAAMATSAATYDQQQQTATTKALKVQTDLADQQKALLVAQQGLQTQQQASSAAAALDAKILAREGKIQAFREALEAVIVQQAKVEGLLAADTKNEDLVREQSTLLLDELKANQAARALGVRVPYPGAELQF